MSSMHETVTAPGSSPAAAEEATVPATMTPGAARAVLGQLVSRGSLLGIWALVVLGYGLYEPDRFLRIATFQNIFSSPVQLIFLSLALVTTFYVGEFDLSVASVMGLAGTTVSLLNVNHGFNPWLASVIGVAAAGFVGLLNGLLVVYLDVNAIVVTLGTGTLIGGVALWMTDLLSISGLPPSFSDYAIHPVFGISVSFFYGFALTLLIAYAFVATPMGLRMSFVGTNREVARLSGVRVNRIRLGSYIASGLISGIGGVVLAATLGGYDPSSSPNYLLPAVSAVFLGTAVIQPGKFNPLGAFVGIYFLQTGIVGLQLAGLTGYIQDLFYGGTLVVAVTISTVIRRRERA
jgi:ribose transport system permease protein